jgi:hypothetical protein
MNQKYISLVEIDGGNEKSGGILLRRRFKTR